MNGNLSHIHAILRTKLDISKPEELNEILDKIRGCVSNLVNPGEFTELKEKGLISSVDHLVEILELAKAYLTHHCHDRCQIPKTDSNGNTVYVCKVQENYYRSRNPEVHTIETVNVNRTCGAEAIYERLNMMKDGEVLEECLKSEFHVPVSSLQDPKFSPTNPHLFSCFPSSQNLQFTTGRTISSYLVKYVTKVDDVARALIKPPGTRDPSHARAVVEKLHNTKITSNKIQAAKTRQKDRNYARLVTHTE
ncbi:MAG: hypothetical protein AAGJ35_15635, partial [Myxococcota bacterium]